MVSGYLRVLISVLSLLINTSVQVVIFRCFPGWGLLKSEYWGFGAGFLSLSTYEFCNFFNFTIPLKEFVAILVVNLITYFSLCYCYFNFVNLSETARRARILRELYDFPEGLSLQELLLRYNAKEIIERRIARLLNNGQIIFSNDRYYIGIPLMLWIAKIIMVMKLMILGRKDLDTVYQRNKEPDV